MRHRLSFVVVLLLLWTASGGALTPTCNPCGGLLTADPLAAAQALNLSGASPPDEVAYVAWHQELDGSLNTVLLSEIKATAVTPWIKLQFRTPSPVAEHLTVLAGELAEAARIARATRGGTAVFQVLWPAADGGLDSWPAADAAFLFKRAAVAIAGGNADAVVATMTMPHDPSWLRSFYDDDMVAYVDLIAVRPAPHGALQQSVELLTELDPGRPLAVDSLAVPADPVEILSAAARHAAAGARITLFESAAPSEGTLQSLSLLAREFAGDLAFDSYATISGVDGAWAFVRGEDLAVQVIVSCGEECGRRAMILFGDRQLSSPVRVLLDGSEQIVYARRTADGLSAPVRDPDAAMVLRLERVSAAELGGFENQVEVGASREMPVEEILERLQAFEDAQSRRIRHYEAHKTMHLRYTSGQGVGSVEVSFDGGFFFRRDSGFDWAWQNLYVNGVRWRGSLPKLPIVQPETAATLPFEINFTKEYRYQLRGVDEVEGRSCWVVDFTPAAGGDVGNLFQGTVWIDRELFCRVKTRAIQLGLEGDVISNEETVFFMPLDGGGQPAPWQHESFFLPTRTVGQEVQSILNAAFPVERETVLERIRINAPGFEERLKLAHQSEVTMVRDTPDGMRYLVKGDDGNRVVQHEVDFDSLALVGGVFYDDNQDYPLPLGGINYFSRDFRGSGQQLNVFFAGILVNANYAEPNLFGSRWDAGGRAFGFFVPGEQVLYRDGEEIDAEAVKRSNARVALFLGRPLGSFTKLSFTYGLGYERYSRADDTDADFVVPQDSFTNSLGTELAFTRAGYNLNLEATTYARSDWQFWGLPGNLEYDPDHETYLRWKVTAAKAWWLSSFMKLAVSLEHVNGEGLDRFSKYDFSSFADSSVGGYQSGLVTASEASGVHLSYGFNMAEALRVELQGDAVWATDPETGLDRELLAGVSLNGTVMGPWQTLVNFDIGIPVQGPADGFTARIAFLKLFN